jgi:ATP-dependent DNA ligase
MRVLQRRDFTIGGYTPSGRNCDAILVDDFEGRTLNYVAKVHGGFTPAVRTALFKQFQGLETKTCPSASPFPDSADRDVSRLRLP